MKDRIHNFNAGPAALPLPVLEEIQASLLNYGGSGMSVTEISHRSKWFDEIINDAIARTKRLLKLSDDHRVLFLQGGASSQFAAIPMNLLRGKTSADYLNTGSWSNWMPISPIPGPRSTCPWSRPAPGSSAASGTGCARFRVVSP